MYATHISFRPLPILLAVSFAVPALAGPAEDQYAVASEHYSQHRWQLATEEFRTFIDEFPDHVQADVSHFFLGEALAQTGAYEAAHEPYRIFLQKQPAHPHSGQATFRLGETAYFSGKHGEARRVLEDYCKNNADDPRRVHALAYLGKIALSTGNSTESRKWFTSALNALPADPLANDCRFGLARALDGLGESVEANRYYQFIARSTDHTLADDAQLRLALNRYDHRLYNQAAKTLAAFDTTFRASDLRTEALYWLGLTQRAQGQWDKAFRTFEKAASSGPQHALVPAIHFYAGDTLEQLDRDEEADKHYELVRTDKKDCKWADDSLHAQIRLALDGGDHNRAESLAGQFDQYFPHSPLRHEVLQAKGRSLLAREQYTDAAILFERLLADSRPGTRAADVLPEQKPSHVDDSQRPDTRVVNAYLLSLCYLGQQRHRDALRTVELARPEAGQGQLADGMLVVQATALVALNRHADAIQPLGDYLKSQPSGSDAARCRSQLTLALAQLDQLDEARAVYEDYRRHHPNHDTWLATTHYLAESAYRAGNTTWARQLFTLLAADGNPSEYVTSGLSGIAWCQFEADDATGSAATFERLLVEDSTSPLAHEAAVMRAKSLEKSGQNHGALAMYYRIIDEFAQTPQAVTSLMDAAGLHVRLSQFVEADALYARVAEQHPQAPQRYTALYLRAWVLIDLDRATEAEKLFRQINQKQKDSPYWFDATYRLAERAMERRDFDRTQRLAGEIIDVGGTDDMLCHTLFLQGQVAAMREHWDQVTGPMRRLADEFSDHVLELPARYWIAEAAYRLENYEQADTLFSDLEKRTPDANSKWVAMIPLRRAQMMAHTRDWQSAQKLVCDLAERFPEFQQIYEADYLLGRCLAAQARFTEARSAYRRVTASQAGGKTETAAMAQWMIGESYFHQKQYDEAIRAYFRVEILYDYPKWRAAGLLQSAKCYELKKQWKKAEILYARLLKQYPDTEFTEEAARCMHSANTRAAVPTES